MHVWIACIIRNSIVRKHKRTVIDQSYIKVLLLLLQKYTWNDRVIYEWCGLFSAIFTANIITWFPCIIVGLAISVAVVDSTCPNSGLILPSHISLLPARARDCHPPCVSGVSCERNQRSNSSGLWKHGSKASRAGSHLPRKKESSNTFRSSNTF